MMRINPTMAQRRNAMLRSTVFVTSAAPHLLAPMKPIVLIREDDTPEDIKRKARAAAAPLRKQRA